MATAKVFWSGRSQAVRLPKEFRFDSTQVRIRRDGDAVILEPMLDEWAWLEPLIGTFGEDAAAYALEDQPEQERPELDFFK